MKCIVMVLLFCSFSLAQQLSNAAQPQTVKDYSSGFGYDNQLYALQGAGVGFVVGIASHRPWLGAAAGVGSCVAWRGYHDRLYINDHIFSSNRVTFCAVGAGISYATEKLIYVGRKK